MSEGIHKSSREFELERLVFFSDAVFAIAITLLVVDIGVPAEVPDQDVPEAILGLLPQVAAFALSFAVIGTYWVAHHRIFRFIERWDGGLIRWNLLLLFFVAVQPVTTSLLGFHGDLPLPTIIYALFLAATGLSSTGLCLHAYRAGLFSDQISRRQSRFLALRAFVVPVVFILSIPVVPVSPSLAQGLWLLIWPAQMLLRRRLDVELLTSTSEQQSSQDRKRD